MQQEVVVYARQTDWLLGQFMENLAETNAQFLDIAPPGTLECNNLLAVARHAAGVTRAYVLGIGCALPVTRDRSLEFTARARERPAILAEIRELRKQVPAAMTALDDGALGQAVVPSQALFGAGVPHEMTRREAIVENIRHLGIHLGELRLTRSLLEGAQRQRL